MKGHNILCSYELNIPYSVRVEYIQPPTLLITLLTVSHQLDKLFK